MLKDEREKLDPFRQEDLGFAFRCAQDDDPAHRSVEPRARQCARPRLPVCLIYLPVLPLPAAVRDGFNAVADRIDSITTTIGKVVAWLTLATVLICFATVYLRYALHIGLIWLQELYAWTHVAAITMGAGYVLLKGGFVRVDMLYARLSKRGKAWVDLLGTIFLMAPFLVHDGDCGLVVLSLVDDDERGLAAGHRPAVAVGF